MLEATLLVNSTLLLALLAPPPPTRKTRLTFLKVFPEILKMSTGVTYPTSKATPLGMSENVLSDIILLAIKYPTGLSAGPRDIAARLTKLNVLPLITESRNSASQTIPTLSSQSI